MHKGDNAQVRSDTQRPYHVRSCLRAINCDMAITLALEALSLCSDFRLLVLTGPLLRGLLLHEAVCQRLCLCRRLLGARRPFGRRPANHAHDETMPPQLVSKCRTPALQSASGFFSKCQSLLALPLPVLAASMPANKASWSARARLPHAACVNKARAQPGNEFTLATLL